MPGFLFACSARMGLHMPFAKVPFLTLNFIPALYIPLTLHFSRSKNAHIVSFSLDPLAWDCNYRFFLCFLFNLMHKVTILGILFTRCARVGLHMPFTELSFLPLDYMPSQ